jgi:lipopolysaccharide export system permease protein
MLFKKSLRRDMANLAGVVFATLFTIMVTTTLIRTLGRRPAAYRHASILPLIAFTAINFLPVLLVLTLYIAILMSLTRAYRDSEMVIWFASGRSLLHFVRPVMSFALPFVVLVAGLSFSVAPWANRQIAEYQQRFEQRQDVSQVSAGQFRESASASRVFFVESISEDEKSVRNVFVTQQRGDEVTIVVRRGGHHRRSQRRPLPVLERPPLRRREGRPEALDEMVELGGLRIDPALPVARDESTKAKPSTDLIRDPTARHLGELLWRIGLPLSAVALALLAIPLSSFNPRVGRSINLIVALLVYVTYSNLLSLSQAWVVQGRLPFGVGVWLIHVILLAVAAVMFWRRVSLARWGLPRWRGRRAAA